MIHLHLQGNHDQTGQQWGSLLRESGVKILDHIPFPITRERMEYAEACLPVYRQYYPALLKELEGLAAGQDCDVQLLQAVLFSMYAILPACHCSCFAVAEGDEILFGRNSDFLTALEEQNTNVIAHLTDGAFSFTGNTTSFIQIEDGVNQKGLAVGLTSVSPTEVKPGFNAGLLVRYLLETCGTVPEALEKLKTLPIGSAQTLTLADEKGNLAVVECNAERIETTGPADQESPFVCASNVFHLPRMRSYNRSVGDDWFAEQRYQTMQKALNRKDLRKDLSFAKDLLSGRYGFLCQYDRSTGKDTVWSVVYDLKRHKVYRSESNPGRSGYQEDARFNF